MKGRSTFFKAIGPLIFIGILGGCSIQGMDGVKTVVRQDAEAEAPTKLLGPEIPKLFVLNGSIGLLQEDANGWHGKLNWQQKQGDFSMSILGPFGDVQAELINEAGVLKLKAPNGQLVGGSKLEQWQKQSFGTQVPFQALPYWLHGVPYPAMEDAKVKKTKDEVSLLQQEGWQIGYSEWKQIGGHKMPSRITMAKAKVRIKLVVNDYSRG